MQLWGVPAIRCKSMTGKPPRISIITPCLNGERYLVDAIESVLRQNYANCEHIIFDGGSTDNTGALLRRYDHLIVVREPDEGSHDAMNAGIRRASGDIMGFLNVDDIYPAQIFAKVATAFAANPGTDVVVGDSIVFEDVGSHRSVRFVFRHPHGVWMPECLFGNPAINACFYRRSVFTAVGLFDNGYAMSADRDFFIRMSLANVTSTALNSPAACYRAHNQSQTINRERSNILAIAKELCRMASKAVTSPDSPQLSSASRIDPHLARTWLAFESARLAFLHLRRRQFAAATKIAWRYGSLWPRLPHALALRRGARRTYRGGWNADLSAFEERMSLAIAKTGPEAASTVFGVPQVGG